MSHQRMLQLDPQIPVATPKGNGQAIGWLDYSQEHHMLWIVAQDTTGEVWIWANSEIRLRDNPTAGRRLKAGAQAKGQGQDEKENLHEFD